MSIVEASASDVPGEQKKVVFVGDGGSGKSCLLLSYTTGVFPETYVPTVFENYTCNMKYEKKIVEVALWDTAGQPDYDRLRPLAYPNADVILICFALNDRVMYINLMDKWYPEIKHFCVHVPIILVGCKSDLRDSVLRDPRADARRRELTVSAAEGQEMAARMGAKYVECSAKDRDSMQAVFDLVLKVTLAKKIKKIRKKVCNVM